MAWAHRAISKWSDLDGSLSSKTEYLQSGLDQTARATIGPGTIIVRDQPDMSLAGLNRDLSQALQTENRHGFDFKTTLVTDTLNKVLDPEKGWQWLNKGMEIKHDIPGFIKGEWNSFTN